MNIILILAVIALQLILSLLFLFIGFYMGRKTQDKDTFIPNISVKKSQTPIEEYDPFLDAMEDRSFEKTIKE